MFEEVITTDGDTVDLIAFKRFGAHGMEAAILDANPGLANLETLPAGVVVRIPVPGIPDRSQSQRLWS